MEQDQLEGDLRHAIASGELFLDYQPIVGVQTGGIVAAEALVRWWHPQRGLLLPRQFLSVAEQSELILSLDDWSLEQACRQSGECRSRGGVAGELQMCVNFSPRQFENAEFVADVARTLERSGMDPARLQLELTENATMPNSAIAAGVLRRLRALGVRVALDALDAGLLSGDALDRIEADVLKLNGSLIRQAGSDAGMLAIIESMVDLAHALEMIVTAEGIETAGQADVASALGCDRLQGFYFFHPMPATAMGRLLRAQRS